MGEQGLRREIGPVLLTLYGVGVMVGAGIYVLTGAAAGAAGFYAPLAFLLAGLVAAPTALSYAELSVRIPEAAGEAAYVGEGLASPVLARLVGLMVMVTGMVSGAAVLRGGVGYLTAILDVPAPWAIVLVGVLLTLIAMVGALESLAVIGLLTLAEVGGLAMVIWAGFAAEPVAGFGLPLPPPEWRGIAYATILGFFAFIGFEDMVNMAEETRDPGRTMPRAILAALAIVALLYALVVLAAVRAVPREVLAGSEQPLALVWEAATGRSAAFLSAIAVAAAVNGILAQIVMASRVLYGLGKWAPLLRPFRAVHPRLGTPVRATALVGGLVVLGALALPVATLAQFAAQILLVVFTLVNAALIALKRRAPRAAFTVPPWVPWSGLLLSLAALAASLWGGVG